MRVLLSSVVLAATASNNALAKVELAPIEIHAPTGVIMGQYGTAPGTGKSAREFLGIPFAEAPVGPLRWKPPVAHEPWNDTLIANATGPACAQLWDQNEPLVSPSGQGEDCLYLNVHAPAEPKSDSLPVLVYIYGGSFMNGDTSLYSDTSVGNNFATDNDDIIFVCFNYRLGALGWLGLEELAEETGAANTTGNYGIQDQRLALEWVHHNIRSFGGDPTQVTVAGESAGAISVAGHLMSKQTPASDTDTSLFRAMFMESGTAFGSFSYRSDATSQGMSFKSCVFDFLRSELYTGPDFDDDACSDGASTAAQLECLRAVPWDHLLFFTSVMSQVCPDTSSPLWQPTIDGYEWDMMPLEMAKSGGAAKNVTMVVGDVVDEGTLFTLAFLEPLAKAGLLANVGFDAAITLVWSLLGDGLQLRTGLEFLKLYHPHAFFERKGDVNRNETVWQAVSALGGDALFNCPNRALSRTLVEHGHQVFVYEFQDAPRCWTPSYPYINDNLRELSVFHESDVPYFFNTADAMAWYTSSCQSDDPLDPAKVRQCDFWPVPNFATDCPLDQPLATDYFGYLTNFIRSGDPNVGSSVMEVEWPSFNVKEDRVGLDKRTTVLEGESYHLNDRCDAWDEVDLEELMEFITHLMNMGKKKTEGMLLGESMAADAGVKARAV